MRAFLFMIVFWAPLASANDSQLLGQLRSFMFDDKARRDFANQRADSRQANQFMEQFPPWAQQELMEIVMMIMTEKGSDADSYAKKLQAASPQVAAQQFSPQVQARVKALEAKLSSDPQFNNSKKLDSMKRSMPSH